MIPMKRLLLVEDDVHVIFLTARDDKGSVVMGLDIGGDDYITKPFRIRELQSRIRSVLRRSEKKPGENQHMGCLG